MLFACSPSGNEELFVEMRRLGPAATAGQLSEVNDRFHAVSLPGDEGPPWRRMFAEEPRQNSGSPAERRERRVGRDLAGRAYDNVRDRWAFIMVHFT
jgi:hypothetical protein